MPGTLVGTVAWKTSTVRSGPTSGADGTWLLFLPGTTMFGFRIMPVRSTRACSSSSNTVAQRELGGTSWQTSMSWVACGAVHQHFRLDDRDNAGFLAQRGIARQRMGIGVDRPARRQALADADHAAPFGEAGAQLAIFVQPFAAGRRGPR